MSKRIVILGGGAGGAVVAHRLSKRLKDMSEMILIDKNEHHEFRPSYLWVATGLREPDDVRRPLSLFSSKGVKVINDEVTEIDPSNRVVKTSKSGNVSYDYLVVSLGAELRPEQLEGAEQVYHAWELEDALKLRNVLSRFRGGKVIVGPSSPYYRCAPAPFELALMIRYISEQRNIADKTEIKVIHPTWREPMEPFGPFMQRAFRSFLEQYNVEFLGGWEVERIDGERKRIVSKKGDELEYDLPIIVPPHSASKALLNTPELIDKNTSYMSIDKNTLRNPSYDDVFGIGDIVSPTLGLGMAGIFAHFEGDYVATQIVDEVKGVHMAMTYNKSGVCVMDIGYLGAAVYCDFSKVISGEAKYPDCWMLGGMKAFRGAKIAFEKTWFAELFGR